VNTVDLLARALPPAAPPEEPLFGVCCVTGTFTDTIARRQAILPSFTNLDLLCAPSSDRIGLAAWRVLTYTEPNPGKARERRPLQQSSWLCDGNTITLLDRRGVRQRVLDGVAVTPWAGYVTKSYKKHGALRAKVNQKDRQVWLFESLLVDCSDRENVASTWARLRAAQDAGISRPLIESLDIAPGYMAKIGWRVWRDFEVWARPRYRSPLYLFLAYLLPSREELTDG
jgi:hypothetical protein